MFDRRRYRILAVIADAATRRSLEMVVGQWQWDVEFVYRVEDAVRRQREELAPVVICEASGVGDWRRLVGESLPLVVVISHLADDALWQEVLQAGGYDVLRIPLEGRELGKVLEVAGSHWRHRAVLAVN